MTIELNWHEGDDQPGVAWEDEPQSLPFATEPPQTIAQAQRPRPRLHLPAGRSLLLILAAPLFILAVAAAILLWRAGQGNQLARQDIERSAQLLLSAQRAGDVQLYDELLDPLNAAWRQARLAGLAGRHSQPAPQAVSVQSVELTGSRAIAEIAETAANGAARRKLAFFRLVGGQWLLTPAWAEAFGPEASLTSPHFRVYYRARDAALARPLVEAAEGAYVILCGELRCQADSRPLALRLQYVEDGRLQAGGGLTLPSPWLTGAGEDGQPSEALYRALVWQLAEQMARAKAPQASAALWQAVAGWAAADLASADQAADDPLQAALQSGSILPLDAAWREVIAGADNELAAAQVRSLLSFARTTAGSDAVGRLLEALPGDAASSQLRSQALEYVLPRALNTSLYTFQQSWLVWLGYEQALPPGASIG